MQKRDRYDIEVKSARNLTADQEWLLDELLTESLRADYGASRTGAEIEHVVNHVSLSRRDPNGAVGKALLRRGQVYSNAKSVTASRDGWPVAHFTVADNVSSRRPWPLGSAERTYKLHTERGLHKRWMWVGIAALSAEVRAEVMSAEVDQRTIIDRMLNEARRSFDGRQPVATYPYDGETVWQRALDTLGFEDVTEEEHVVHPFGEGTAPVREERWTLGSVALLGERLAAKS